jgi:hypothetical protein
MSIPNIARIIVTCGTVLLSVTLLALSVGCAGEIHTVTWENGTDQEVFIDIGDDPDDFAVALMPCSSKEQQITQLIWDGIVIVRSSPVDELYRTKVSWNELKAQGFRVAIRPDLLPPPPVADASQLGSSNRCQA